MFQNPPMVELADGQRIKLTSLLQRVPSTVRRSEEHLRLCEWVADQANLEEDARCVYVNQLVMHSRLLLGVSGLRFLIREQAISAVRLRSPVPLPSGIELDMPSLAIIFPAGTNRNYLSWRTYGKVFLKIWTHGLYRLVGRIFGRLPQRSQAIRAYVERSLVSHKEHLASSVILAYPYKTNWLRQFRFFRGRQIGKLRLYLMGLPYGWFDSLRLLLGLGRRDEAIITLEVAAAERHARELHRWGFQEVYSDSESETIGWVLNGKLQEHGIRTTNVVHGIGVYGPYLLFDECHFLNAPQQEYYRHRSRLGSAKILREDINPPSQIAEKNSPASHDAIVLLRGNWGNAGKEFERDFETQVAAKIREIAREWGLPFWVKFHPNSGKREQQKFCEQYSVQPAPSLTDDPPWKAPVFINTLSTVYYQAREFGPVIFARHPWQDPRDVFGNEITTATLDELPGVIEHLVRGD